MPEGHTLHRLALDLSDAFAGEQVRVSSPQGRFADSAALLDGQVVTGAEAWGKQLFVEFPGEQYVHIHLGLYGKLDLKPYAAEPPLPVGQVRLRLVGSETYADLRGATTCNLVTAAQRDVVVAKLGPDPLRDDAEPNRAWLRISRSRTSIGALLMDQSVLAGVGNVYRAEVLFRHRIDPMRPGNTLRRKQWDAIWADLVELMKDGVEKNRIDTVRFEHTPEAMGRPPRKDDHGGEVYVYRRHGQPCLVCGTSVRTTELQQRNLFWCPKCQRTYRPRTSVDK
ncbi:endonuclease-8 [Nocardioides luteus]|uniref:DNA-(apurinic or apyrimidinic site) lyase n=1 Tax=Nocardioides luteus TaxID=1844 RepID=A0ABQ5T660_9ACTN|nr:Fpg/Nei family DNA glycosylase [Nocardioides luteus]MDR7309626.1 endonuclease-8 [Nocardioides luteus]GGR70326.1 endonuclease VIII [Nocardioides luteus]GLJ70591.1 endonuclease VIII [Nocardioides luteus]